MSGRSAGPTVWSLTDAERAPPPDAPIGGKARGLAWLTGLGLRVPPALVLLPSEAPVPLEVLRSHLASLGPGPWAVRSSASDEDGSEASFAGQYLSVLNVATPEDVQQAVADCVASVASAQAQAYRDTQGEGARARMAVVIQVMVPASAAGVLFTLDPVSGRRDRTVVDAVSGLGEALVSGHATPDHCTLNPDGAVASLELVGETPILSAAQLAELAREAHRAARADGGALDMEWAIDADGTLWWLQARPITRIPPDPRALDTANHAPTDVHTRCNIGEMMPGAVTPLTQDITGRGIDIGLQDMMVRCGAQARREERVIYISAFFGHLFLNLTALARIATAVAGSTTERMGRALCGRPIPEVDPGPDRPMVIQAFNGLRYALYLMGAKRAQDRLDAELAQVTPIPEGPAIALLPWIEVEVARLYRVYAHHLQSSATAGALTPALLEVLAEGALPTEEHHARLAALIRVDGDVESADIASGMDAMVSLLTEDSTLRAALLERDDAAALSWLASPDSGALGALWRDYLGRHGHRVVRELEFFQREWGSDPQPLLKALRLAGQGGSPQTTPSPQAIDTATESRGVQWLVARTRAAVQGREQTKSQLAWMTAQLKRGFRELGRRLVSEGHLPDPDLVFFFDRDGLTAFVRQPDPDAIARAQDRQVALAHQQTLRFPEIFVGAAEPEPPVVIGEGGPGWLRGKPVSRGVVEGPARVVRQLSEALEVQPGEILVAPVTDVGWTPCFGVIAGVVTEVGSAVSHGAVVAREYGLPAVVNVHGATSAFETGDRLVLDANRGLVYRAGTELPDGL